MGENTVFSAGLEIVPKFNRNEGKKELKSAMKELQDEVNNINNNLKIGVIVDDSKLKTLVKGVTKTLNEMGAAFDAEKGMNYTNKLTTGLKQVMESASGVRSQAIGAIKELNKLSKYTNIAKDKTPDTSKYYLDLNRTMKMPTQDVNAVRTKVAELKERLAELSALRVNINIDRKQVTKLDDAIRKTEEAMAKLKTGLSFKTDKELLNFTPQQSYSAVYNTIGEIEKRQKNINRSTQEGVDLYGQMEIKRKGLINVLYAEQNKQKEINSTIKDSVSAGKDIMKLPERNITDVNTKMNMLKENVQWLDMVKVEFNLDSKQVKSLNGEIDRSKEKIKQLQAQLDGSFKFKSNEDIIGSSYNSSTENTLAQKEIVARMKEINTTTIEGEQLYSQMGEKVRQLKIEEKERVSIGNQINETLGIYIRQNEKAISMPSRSLDEAKAKANSLKQALADLSNIGNRVTLDYDQVTKVRSEIDKTKKELSNLTKSLKTMPDANLMQMTSKSENTHGTLINELRRRQSMLNFATKEGSAEYKAMENRINSLNRRKAELTNTTSRVTQSLERNTMAASKNNSVTHQMGILARQYMGVYAVVRAAQNLRDITGEFELQRVALGAIIRDQHKANQLFEVAKQQALESPFQVKDVVTYMKQLSAFQIDKNEIAETTSRLADISAGLGVDMSRIILAYGQVKAASVLRGQELRQFTEAGIPLVERLAQKFTLLNGKLVTTSDMFGLISERKVPFEMVKDVMWEMTEAGGAFFDMQKKQAQTIKGSASNLADEIQVAYDKIGQANYGVIKGTIDTSREFIRFSSNNMDAIKAVGAAFLIAKASAMLYNNALTEQGKIIERNIKQEQRSRYVQTSISRIMGEKTSDGERVSTKGIFTKNTKVDIDYARDLVNSKTMNKELATRLLLYNRLDKQTIAYFQKNNLLSTTAIAKMRLLNMQNNQLAIGWMKVRVSLIGAAAAMKAFAVSALSNPMLWITVAISAIAMLYSKLSAAKEAAEEFRKATRVDANENLFRLDKNINEINPDTKKDIEQINNLLKEGNIEENKKLLNTEEYSQKLTKINGVLSQSVSENEFLNKLIKERLIGLTSELEKYEAITNAITEYKDAYKSMAANPELLTGIIDDTDIDDLLKSLTDGYSYVMNELNEGISKGKPFSNLREEFTNAISENDIEKVNQLIQSNVEIFGQRTANIMQIRYNKASLELDVFTKNIQKQFNLTTEKGVTLFKAHMDNIKKTGSDTEKFLVNTFEKTIYMKIGLKFTEDKDIKDIGSEYRNRINEILKKFGVRGNTKTGKEEAIYGFYGEGTDTPEEIAKIAAEKRDADKRRLSILSTSKGTLEEEKAIAEANAKISEEIANIVGAGDKDKAKPPKGKSAIEIQAENIKNSIDLIKELQKRYEEYLKYASKDKASKQATDLFKDVNGKSTLPLEFQSEYTEEQYSKFLIAQKEALKNLYNKASRDDKGKITNQIESVTTEINSVTVKNATQVSENILAQLQKELDKTKGRIDLYQNIFDSTGNDKLAKSIAIEIEGEGGFDMIDSLKKALRVSLDQYFDKTIHADLEKYNKLSIDLDNAKFFPEVEAISNKLGGGNEIWGKAFGEILERYKNLSKEIIQNALSGLDKYKEIELQKVDITRKAQKDIEDINIVSIADEKKVALIKAKVAEQQANLTLQQFKESDWYTEVFSNIDMMSREVMIKTKEKILELIELLKKEGKVVPSEIKTLMDKVTQIDELIQPNKFSFKDMFSSNQVEKEAIQKEVDRLNKEKYILEADIANYENVTLSTTSSPEEKAAANELLISTSQNLIVVTKELTDAEKKERDILNQRAKANKEFRAELDNLGNSLSEMQNLTGGVTTVVQGLSKAFGGKENEEFAKTMEVINETIVIGQAALAILNSLMVVKAAVDGTATGTQLVLNAAMLACPAFWIVGGIMALVASLKLFSYLADKAANDEIDAMNKALEDSDRIIKQMESSLYDLAGNDYYGMINNQIAEMTTKVAYAQRQLAAENSKTKPDEDKVAEYTANINDLQQSVIDKQRQLVEEMAGGNIKALTEDLINVWVDAYKSGKNTFAALKERFGEMIQGMVTKTIMAQVIKKNLESIFNSITKAMEDGNLSKSEIDELTQLSLMESQRINQNMNAMSPLLTSIGNLFGTTLSSMGGIKDGISGASEETVSILAGYWLSHLNVTTMMANEVSIIRQLIESRVQTNLESAISGTAEQPISLNEIMFNQLAYLSSIEANTRINSEKTAQFYDRFDQFYNSVVVPNPNGDTAFGIKTIN